MEKRKLHTNDKIIYLWNQFERQYEVRTCSKKENRKSQTIKIKGPYDSELHFYVSTQIV